jgi:hypothetical protein
MIAKLSAFLFRVELYSENGGIAFLQNYLWNCMTSKPRRHWFASLHALLMPHIPS